MTENPEVGDFPTTTLKAVVLTIATLFCVAKNAHLLKISHFQFSNSDLDAAKEFYKYV